MCQYPPGGGNPHNMVKKLHQKKAEGEEALATSQKALAAVLSHTSPEGCLTLSSDLQQLTMSWNQFIMDSEEFKEKQKKMSKNVGDFRSDIEVIVKWILN